jgi:DNA invertase Pin-like site-specific DNA recombinase
MRIGYARVSTQEQNLNLQKDVLKRAGCEKIVSTSPAARVKHGGLGKLRELMRKGDVVVVWWLDWLGRSLMSCRLSSVISTLHSIKSASL